MRVVEYGRTGGDEDGTGVVKDGDTIVCSRGTANYTLIHTHIKLKRNNKTVI